MKTLQTKHKSGTNKLSVRVSVAHVSGDLENRVLRQALKGNLVSVP